MPSAEFLVSTNSSIGNSDLAGSHRFYLGLGCGCIAFCLAVFALLNLLVDPLGMWPLAGLKIFEPYRGRFTSRTAKAEAVAHGQYDTILLGTSRVEFGLAVDDPVFNSARTYNLGLEGTSLSELGAALDFAMRHNQLKRVIFGVDFLLFSGKRVARKDFESSRFNPHLNFVEYYLRELFDWDATLRSWSLVERLRRHKLPSAAYKGFVPKTIPVGLSQRRVFARRIHEFLITGSDAYGGYVYSEEQVALLRKMLENCQRKGVEVIVFIPPVHASQLETIREAGLWQSFEHWKREMTEITSSNVDGPRIPFWDFTGFVGRVAEEVPPSGDKITRMKWYIESSHFTPALGRIILQKLYGSAAVGADGEDRFGVPLSLDNVDRHLEQLRRDREQYVSEHPQEIEWVRQIASRKNERWPGENPGD
jgi:hypothetical protein